jgi:hypothetical protein
MALGIACPSIHCSSSLHATDFTAIAMERRLITEGEQRVARQEMLMLRLTELGNDTLTPSAEEVLRLLREGVERSWARLRDLEERHPQ